MKKIIYVNNFIEKIIYVNDFIETNEISVMMFFSNVFSIRFIPSVDHSILNEFRMMIFFSKKLTIYSSYQLD